jgi:hypothetical protein
MNNLEKLLNAGFSELPARDLWYNRELRMAFSRQALRDMDSRWIERYLGEKVAPNDFIFFYVRPPEDLQNCKKILEEIGLSSLLPNIRLVTLAHS